MRTRPRTKPTSVRDREDRLRAGRLAAQTLRRLSSTAMFVDVQLRFLPATAPAHVAQSFVLYPAAKAHFAYPCPYGDCSGIYNLDIEASRTIARQESGVTGTLECAGLRSRNGRPGEQCGLEVRYTITTKHEAESAVHACSPD